MNFIKKAARVDINLNSINKNLQFKIDPGFYSADLVKEYVERAIVVLDRYVFEYLQGVKNG